MCERVVLREFVSRYVREVELRDVDNITHPIGNVSDNG